MSHDTYSYFLNASGTDLMHRDIESSKVASCLWDLQHPVRPVVLLSQNHYI
jgi:hypothetical protein